MNHDPLALEGLILVHAPSEIPGFEPGIRVALPNPKAFVRYAMLMIEAFGADALGPIMYEQFQVLLGYFDPSDVKLWADEAKREAISWKHSAAREISRDEVRNGTLKSPVCD